ncbi:uncharacterized protein LOC131932934 [Physella acuta]|uniref:uncharacterized protein LOC131932934 n=1 Tax=Physella acuta TaxID=109671 RepID=UPI0027DCFEAA|nr:uncharacterized protein LOC131932934 [Physella acuta]
MAKQMKLRTGQISLQLSGTKGTGEWTNIDSRRLTGGEIVKKMIISDLDIGEVTQVKLKFFPDSRAKRNQVVLVQKVEVNCPARFPTKYFTGKTFKVRSTGITLSGGDFTLPAAS